MNCESFRNDGVTVRRTPIKLKSKEFCFRDYCVPQSDMDCSVGVHGEEVLRDIIKNDPIFKNGKKFKVNFLNNMETYFSDDEDYFFCTYENRDRKPADFEWDDNTKSFVCVKNCRII